MPSSSAVSTAEPIPTADLQALNQGLKETRLRFNFGSDSFPSEDYSLWDMGVRLNSAAEREFSEKELLAFCQSFSENHNRKPVDASIEQSGDFHEPYRIVADIEGYRVDADTLYTAIKQLSVYAPPRDFEVPLDPVNAELSREDLIRSNSLIATYTTSFSGSTYSKPNRVHNIKLAAKHINGSVVEAEEIFSCNRTIGDRNKKNGWKMAAAIAGGTYTQEYGGGVCQVSSTLFNVVLMADLEITERHHHSWPMSYVPIGRDATISTGIKDFCFLNSSGAPVTLFTHVDEEAQTITVALYGTPSSDFAYIEIESERTGSVEEASPIYHLDESLPQGSKNVEREGRRGRKSVTYVLYYDSQGKLIRKRTAYRDVYPSIAEVAYVSADIYYK